MQKSKPLDHSDSQQGPITYNYAFNGKHSSNDGLQDDNSDVEVKDISHYFPDEQAHVNHHELVSVGNTIPSSIIVSSPSCEVKSSIKKDFVMLESSVEEPSNIMEISSQESIGVLRESGEVLCIPPKQKHKTEHDSAFPKLMVESELIAASIATKSKVAGGNVIEEKNNGFIKECDVSRYNFTPMKYTNNGLHSFYESNHYAMRSMENINCINAMPELSSLGNNGFSSSVSTSIFHTERFSTKDFLLAAG